MKMSTMSAAAALAVIAATPVIAQAMTPTEYLKAAGASDLYEKQSSVAVLKTSTDPKVRSYAQMMIRDHAASTAKVKAAAMKSKIMVKPPMLMPAQAELIAQLNAESGSARDATYIAQQKASHNQALTVQKTYAMDGTAPALRMAAKGIVPVVEHHIAMLKTM